MRGRFRRKVAAEFHPPSPLYLSYDENYQKNRREETALVKEERVRRQKMHRKWNRDAKCKFMEVEDEAWFVKTGKGTEVSVLVEMLLAVTEMDLSDDAAVKELDGKLEDGRLLLGYASGGMVEVHGPLSVSYPSFLLRLEEVFGDVYVVGPGRTASIRPNAAEVRA